MVWENWAQVKEASFTLSPLPFILSTIIFALSYFIQIWAWYLITVKLGIAISFSETLENWFYSQLGKYLPGKVWLLLGRFYLYESKGKPKKEISMALYFEMGTMILAGSLIFLVALLFFKEARPFYFVKHLWWVIFLFIFVFISLHPRLLQRIFNWVLIRFQKEPIHLSISYSDILWILSICILSWAVGGVGFYLFIESIFPVSSKYILFLTGALAISSTMGMIALFAPSGLGVREGALVYLLSSMMPGAVAVVISIVTRVWMTLIDIGLIGMIYLLSQFRKAKVKKNQHV